MPLRYRYRWCLRARLLAVLLLALLPIAVLLGFLWTGARDRDRDDSLRSLTQTAEAVAVIADNLFDEGIALGYAIATDPDVQALDPGRITPRLRALKARVPHYANIVVVDVSGTIVGRAVEGSHPDAPQSVADLPFFRQVAERGQPATIPVVGSQDLSGLGSGVAVPIQAADGSAIGVVAVVFDFDQVSERLAQVGLFRGQVLTLIDQHGRVATLVGRVTRTAANMTWEQRDRSRFSDVQAALAGTPVATDTYLGPMYGEPRLAAFVPTPRHRWVVGATWTIEEALGPARQALTRELSIFAAIVLVILAGAAVASRALIVPLRRLAEHARHLAAGRFEPIADADRGDEIGDLTRTFNVMGEQLQRTVDDLRRQRAQLEAILHQLPVGVVICTAPDGDLLLVNEQAEAIWGQPFATRAVVDRSTLGRGFYLDGREYGPRDWPIGRALRDGEAVRGEEIVIQRRDGIEGVILVNSAPIRNEDGEIVAAVAVADDVTARRETEAQLRERDVLLQALLDQFPASVGVLDRDLRYVLAAGRRLIETGLSPDAMIGSTVAELYSAELTELATRHADRAFAGEMTTYSVTEQGICLDVTMLPLRNLNGSIGHVLSIAFDVTDERERRERVVRDEKLHALGQMAGGIAHNLNQMLTLVSGYGELVRDALDREPTDRAEVGRMVRIIERAAYDGGETVKRLLTFARGQGSERRQMVDVADLLHEVEQLTAPRWRDGARAEGRKIELRVEAETGVTIVGSQAGLREALTNLVLNALDAMPHGGTIALSARRQGDRVQIQVADSGTGMTAEVRRQIFEPFFTTKGEHGTGLGLAMVFGIVRHHGGQIDVTSEPGRGTTMHLHLPVGSDLDVGGVVDEEAPSARSLHVLVVDDEVRLATLAAGMLRRDGHQATTAFSGQEAVERLQTATFDLVISDLSMGEGMNGWELAAATGQIAPGLPVVLATGWGAAIDEEEARSRGVQAVLAKPFRIADLREVVSRVLAA